MPHFSIDAFGRLMFCSCMLGYHIANEIELPSNSSQIQKYYIKKITHHCNYKIEVPIFRVATCWVWVRLSSHRSYELEPDIY